MKELKVIQKIFDRGFQRGLFENCEEAATALQALSGIEKKLSEAQAKPKDDEETKN